MSKFEIYLLMQCENAMVIALLILIISGIVLFIACMEYNDRNKKVLPYIKISSAICLICVLLILVLPTNKTVVAMNLLPEMTAGNAVKLLKAAK